MTWSAGDTRRRASPNVELVRSVYAAWERGDYSDTAWAHPEIEIVYADGPAPGSWTGWEAQGWREWLSAWEDFRIVAETFHELDDERVLVLMRFGGRGKASGLDVAETWAKGLAVFHLRDGAVTRVATYLDREHALADLGLPPEPGSLGS